MNGSGEWSTQSMEGDAHSLHLVDLPAHRGIWSMSPTRSAFVLGSSQSAVDVDAEFCASQGIDLVRRRSGGGAVYVDPNDTLWIDVVIARNDSYWVDDVGRSMHFVGRAWSDALMSFGVADLVVNEGSHVANDWSRHLCVAGRGAGEVFSAVTGGKVVGISQRRTRDYARFQCIAYFSWDVDLHARAVPRVADDVSRLAGLVVPITRLDPAAVAQRLGAVLTTR